LALIKRLMLAFPCDQYEYAEDIHDEDLARWVTNFWKECAETEEEKRLLEEYERNWDKIYRK